MILQYKYMPKDFENMNGLDEDLREFYIQLEQRDNQSKKWNRPFEDARKILFYSLKHRSVEGYITDTLKNEIYEYLGGLFDD